MPLGDYSLNKGEEAMVKNQKNSKALSTAVKDSKVKKANPEQILAARLFKERDIRIQYMKKVAELQGEVVKLEQKLADTHQQLIRLQIDKLNKDGQDLLTSVGLKPGDKITDQHESIPNEWVIIEKE